MNLEIENIGQKLMLAAGFLAAGLFVLVSMAANLKFGLSLAATPIDRIIYGALSLAADLMKVALPLVAILLWRKQHRFLSAIAALFCAGVICYSLAAAIGFAASTRGEATTTSRLAIDNRKAWEARIERTARQLDQLGVPRPAGVIQAEIAYRDFVAWCPAEGLSACSRQMFGRRLAEVMTGMGGRKVRINGRAYYEGVVLQGRPAQKQILSAAA